MDASPTLEFLAIAPLLLVIPPCSVVHITMLITVVRKHDWYKKVHQGLDSLEALSSAGILHDTLKVITHLRTFTRQTYDDCQNEINGTPNIKLIKTVYQMPYEWRDVDYFPDLLVTLYLIALHH